MSAISKVLVVLVSFMAVLLVAVTVPHVAQTQDWKKTAEENANGIRAAQAKATNIQAEINAVQERLNEQLAALTSEKASLTNQINTLTQKLANVSAELEDQRNENTKAKADVASLTAISQQYADITETMQKQNDRLLQDNLKLDTRLVEMSDRNNVLESQNNLLGREVRRFQELATNTREELATAQDVLARSGIKIGEQATKVAFEPTVMIQGAVTKVEAAGDETYLQVNVGTNDKVAQNMKFMVHRGDSFLGTLIITRVDSNAAAGRVELAQDQIAIGDKIVTGGS